MDIREESLKKHYQWHGKIEMTPRVPVNSSEDLSLAYTPGVAEPCLEIQKDPSRSFQLTRRFNTIAVVTDGTAVLGLGDIGPEAAMPVMEGKCVLFKSFGGVDAVPICIRSRDADTIVETVRQISGSFGGINLEDISAPRCFEIERRLKECLDIPVFHDDQHGTAVILCAAVTNAFKLTGRDFSSARFVINGAGSAGIAIARLLMRFGAAQIILCDKQGALAEGADSCANDAQQEIAALTNPGRAIGSLADVIGGADVFIGVSGPGAVTGDMIRSMAKDPIVFAMANPVPEIMPGEALAAGAAIVGTGRSDFPNQVNNVLAFPGIFRGALDVRASDITQDMCAAAARAIAGVVGDDELRPDYVLPEAFDPRVRQAVAASVGMCAIETGISRLSM